MSEISNERKRQSTIRTTLAVAIVDPDDPSQSLEGSDVLTIVELVVEDFESDTGLTVEEVVLDGDKDDTDYVPIIIGVTVSGFVFVLLILAVFVFVIVVLL